MLVTVIVDLWVSALGGFLSLDGGRRKKLKACFVWVCVESFYFLMNPCFQEISSG